MKTRTSIFFWATWIIIAVAVYGYVLPFITDETSTEFLIFTWAVAGLILLPGIYASFRLINLLHQQSKPKIKRALRIEETRTLGQFLFESYAGEILLVKELQLNLPRSVGTLFDQLDDALSDFVRFKFRENKPSLEEVREILIEYYESIGWRIEAEDPERGEINGSVYPYPDEIEVCLVLRVMYEDGDDADVLQILTLPIHA
ncbi:MAG: hypothetical protein KBB54_00850 [Candidatus Pacebacteria bacterium]|nr:hypothetical protein [Candidatus Paceibacterota bacterium]MBP9818578.1 hypothetical protein [Candidatus Paceibacterota bacterium]